MNTTTTTTKTVVSCAHKRDGDNADDSGEEGDLCQDRRDSAKSQ